MNINDLIYQFLLQNKSYLIAYIIFMMAYPITSVFLPKNYGKIVDDLKNEKPPKFTTTAILLVTVNIMYLILSKLDNIFIPKLQSYIRVNVVEAVLENYKDKFENQELGILITKIIKLPIIIRDLVYQLRSSIIPLSLIFPFIIIQYMFINRKLGSFILVGIISSICILKPKFIECLNMASAMDSENEMMHEDISEIFDNMLDIYTMNTHDKEIGTLKNNQAQLIDMYKKTFDYSTTLKGILNMSVLVVFLGSIIFSYQLLKKKEITLVEMTNVAITGIYIINMMGGFSDKLPELIFDVGAYMRIQSYLLNLNITPVHKDNFELTKGTITFKDVSINYGTKNIINNFNLVINQGETVAFIGRIGSGKSSLVKALLKLIPYSGTIMLDNVDIANLDTSTVRSQIIYVHQNPIPFNRTLYENITYGNDNITHKQIEDLFEKYGLTKFFDHALNKKVGKKGGLLSGGQRQLIFLLRVYLSPNPIVILDEPTSSLDENSKNYVLQILGDIIKSRTVIIITHDEKVGNIADKKINLDLINDDKK